MTRRSDEAGEGTLHVSGGAGLAAESPPSPVNVLDTGAAAGLLIRGAAGRTIGYVAGLVIGLLAVPLMIRELGVERYGYFITAPPMERSQLHASWVLSRMPGLRPRLAIVPKGALSLIAGLIPALVLSAHLVVLVLSSLAYFAVAQALGAIPTEVVQAFRQRRGGAASVT